MCSSPFGDYWSFGMTELDVDFAWQALDLDDAPQKLRKSAETIFSCGTLLSHYIRWLKDNGAMRKTF